MNNWNDCLSQKDWSSLSNCNNVDDMVEIFSANTRACSNGMLKENSKSTVKSNSYTSDAIHMWNIAPQDIKICKTLFSAKKANLC